MSQFSYWKVKRELLRIGKTAQDATAELVRKLYFRRHYDLVTRKTIKRTPGAVPLGKEVAIYLVFPDSGLLASHLCMLSELRQAGISPIVVSNLPLSDEDRDRLHDDVYTIIERPNVGYDFGGYRDGILELAENLHRLDRVWLLNDSAWLVPQATSWFEHARAMGNDFVGATSSFSILRKTLLGTKRWNISDYRSIIWTHDPNNRDFHYASYALCIGSAILRDRKFMSYWEKLDIRNDKKRTVRRGEMGLSQWVLKHRYTHAATFEINHLDKELEELSDTELDRVARELVIFRGTELAALKTRVLALQPNSLEGRAERTGLILTAVARQGSVYALAIYILRRHHFPFLKKSLLSLSSDGPGTLLEFIASLDQHKAPYLIDEARRICRV
jgi:lipopolysaccharide biosynthesis protein